MRKWAELLSKKLEHDAQEDLQKSVHGDYTIDKVFAGKQKLPTALVNKKEI